jgi:hypothetical protein
MLTSHIHSKWDARFAATTTHLLALQGLTWADVWLPEPERAAADARVWVQPVQTADSTQALS